jgi:hypothetical protein
VLSRPTDTSGSERLTATPRPSTARNSRAASGPSIATAELTAPVTSSSAPIAVFDTATYSVRRLPSARSVT